MTVRISGVVKESIVDGPGIRAAIFLQGCPHHCAGCHNPQTHDPCGGTEYELEAFVQPILQNPLLDGVTLTGGEPFSQAPAAARIARMAREKGLNVWTYTGYTFEELVGAGKPEWLSLLKETDVLIDGRFELDQKTLDKPFVGSRNQRIIDLSHLETDESLRKFVPEEAGL